MISFSSAAAAAVSLSAIWASLLLMCFICTTSSLVDLHKILEVEGDEPRLPVAAVEDDRRAVSEVFSIPLGLLHPFGDFELFSSFDFDVDAWEAYHVGLLAVGDRLAGPHVLKAVAVEDLDKLQLSASAFAL